MKTYAEYVAEAKDIREQLACYQARIAEIVLKVCEIRHGGKSDAYYTMTDFAKDTGFNKRTLSEWVHIYKHILLKVGVSKPTPQEWTTAAYAARSMKNSLIVDNATNGKSGMKRQELPEDEVKKIYEAIQSDDSNSLVKLDRIFKDSKYIANTVEVIDLSIFTKEKLITIMNCLDSASDFINDYLTREKRNVAKI